MPQKRQAKQRATRTQPGKKQLPKKQPPATRIWERKGGWLLFQVENPAAAATRVSDLFCAGGNHFVVIRADVVRGSGFNLVVPLDAAANTWPSAVRLIEKVVGARPVVAARVFSHHPAVPHRAPCFVTRAEYELHPLREFDPPGRHPKSPGANPWG